MHPKVPPEEALKRRDQSKKGQPERRGVHVGLVGTLDVKVRKVTLDIARRVNPSKRVERTVGAPVGKCVQLQVAAQPGGPRIA